jgi:hypothetical protein
VSGPESNRAPLSYKSRQISPVISFVKIYVLITVTIKSTAVYLRFGGSFCLLLQSGQVRQASSRSLLRLNPLPMTFVLIFESFAAVNVRIIVVSEVTPCSLVDMYQCFL